MTDGSGLGGGSNPALITLTTDFAVQSQSVGIMEIVARALAPQASVVHLMHGLPSFDVIAAARTMECIQFTPPGNHVCVCDPGVGTARKAIVCLTGRGDHLIGPDNGVLRPAADFLGGLVVAREITNEACMRSPVSPIFHGRDIFVRTAAFLARGGALDDVGPVIPTRDLAPAPYEEAQPIAGVVECRIVQINKFGSVHLNLRVEVFTALALPAGGPVRVVMADGRQTTVAVAATFGEVAPGEHVILPDDYGRVEVATNLGSLAREFGLAIGDRLELHLGRAHGLSS